MSYAFQNNYTEAWLHTQTFFLNNLQEFAQHAHLMVYSLINFLFIV